MREREHRRHSGMEKAILPAHPSCRCIPKRAPDIEKATEKCIDLQQNCFAHQVDSVISPLPRRTERIQACFQTYSNNQTYAQCMHARSYHLKQFSKLISHVENEKFGNFGDTKYHLNMIYGIYGYAMPSYVSMCATPMLLVGNFEKIKRLKQCS